MPLRLPQLACALSLLLTPAVARDAPAVVPRAATFVFSGGVAEPGGQPVRGAKILLEGLIEPAALTDAEGRFSFFHVVPDVEALAAAPLRLVLRARHRGWNLVLPSGESALATELRIVRSADGNARLEVRSNDAGMARAVAASFGVPGDVTVSWSGGFMRQLGAEDRTEPAPRALELVPLVRPAPVSGVATVAPAAWRADSAAVPVVRRDTARTALPAAVPVPVAVRAAAPVPQPRPERHESMRLFPSAPDPGTTPPPAPAAASKPPRVDSLRLQGMAKAGIVEPSVPIAVRSTGGSSVERDTAAIVLPGIRLLVRPDTIPPDSAGPGPAAGAGRGTALRVALGRALPDTQPPVAAGRVCECQVKGTVEVNSDQPLPGAMRVVVSLEGSPARRDTVALFMGPPRPFDLGRVPCGSHRLEVRPLSARAFSVAPPALDVFDCSAGRTRQFRVVLKPQ
jgi:hypothetical protein